MRGGNNTIEVKKGGLSEHSEPGFNCNLSCLFVVFGTSINFIFESCNFSKSRGQQYFANELFHRKV